MNWGIYLSPSIQVFPKALQCKGSCLFPATALELLYLKTFKAFVQREVTHQKAQKHKLERFFLCGSFLIHEALQSHVQFKAARFISMSYRSPRKTLPPEYTRPSLRTLTRPCLSLEWRFTLRVQVSTIFN